MISRGRGDNSGRDIGTVRYRSVTAWLRWAEDDTDKGGIYRQALDVRSLPLAIQSPVTKLKNGSAKKWVFLGLGPT